LNDGPDIRLPENDVGNALAWSKLDKEDRLFARHRRRRLRGCRTGSCNCRTTLARELSGKETKKKAGDA
jgi:cell division protein FtsQ